MKRPNGTGGIRKLSGRRTKPYQAVITVGRTVNNGKIVPKQASLGVYKTKKEAMQALAEYIADPVNLDGRSWTFAMVANRIMDDAKESMRLRMLSAYNRIPQLHDMRVVDISISDLDRAVAQFEGMSAQTQDSLFILMSRVYKDLIRNDVVRRDLSLYMNRPEAAEPKERVTLTDEEIRIVHERGTDIMLLLLYTGMRIREALGLKMEDVVVDEHPHINVVKSKTENGIRTIPIHEALMPLIEKASGNEYLIEPHYRYNYFMKKWRPMAAELGIEKTPRDFRRTFATWSKSCKMDDFYRRAILGHSQRGLTDQVYTDALLPDLYREMQKLRYE